MRKIKFYILQNIDYSLILKITLDKILAFFVFPLPEKSEDNY